MDPSLESAPGSPHRPGHARAALRSFMTGPARSSALAPESPSLWQTLERVNRIDPDIDEIGKDVSDRAVAVHEDLGVGLIGSPPDAPMHRTRHRTRQPVCRPHTKCSDRRSRLGGERARRGAQRARCQRGRAPEQGQAKCQATGSRESARVPRAREVENGERRQDQLPQARLRAESDAYRRT